MAKDIVDLGRKHYFDFEAGETVSTNSPLHSAINTPKLNLDDQNLPLKIESWYHDDEVEGEPNNTHPKTILDDSKKRQIIQDISFEAEGKGLDKIFEIACEVRDSTSRAPRWKDRKSMYPDKKLSPSDWISTHYEIEGLSMADIHADRPLYDAYRKWIVKHPEDDLQLPTKRRNKTANAEEALERRREHSLASYHRRKHVR